MKKTLALLLVASLLLAGCTELSESDDGETLNIEVNEDIAIEQIKDFMTVDEDESFGITMMYDMDPSMMGMGDMLEVDEDSEAIITMEMTEAWSPDGYHTSSIMGISDSTSSMKFVTSMTHIGTTMYVEMGYVTQGDLCADEETEEDKEMCEMMYGDMPAVQSYSMTTTTTHTEVIAAMAEETQNDGDDMDPMAMLSFLSFVECYGEFTPADSIDGLQIFDVSMDIMEEDSITPKSALCMFDMDDSNTISYEEFLAADDSGEEVDDEEVAELKIIFDESDTNADGELDSDELVTFIEAMDSYDEEHDEGDDHDHGSDHDGHDDMGDDEDPEMMPDMSVAFNNAGEIEYFSMNMEGTTMKMYVLTEDRVDSLFTDVNAGTLVALPFSLSSDMYDDDWDDDWGDDGDFYCNDGTTIPMIWVNDGDEDCPDGEDESNNGDDGDFYCNDGTTIPMAWVNDGDEDCPDGEDESNNGDDGDENYIFYCSNDGEEYAEGMGGILCPEGPDVVPECPNGEECVCIDVDGSCSDGDDDWGYMAVDDEMNLDDFGISSWDSTNDLQEIIDWFNDQYNYGDDEPMLTVDDFLADCNADANSVDVNVAECIFNKASEMLGMYDDSDGDAPSPADLLSMADSDSDGELTPEEFFAFLEMDEGCCLPDEMKSDINDIMNNSDSDSSGTLSESELETFIMDFVSYQDSMEGGEDDGEMDDDGGMDMGDSDENHDHGDGGDDYSDEIVMYISNDMDFHFEGDMSDYKIELATCDYDYDMETGEETSTCTTVMSVAMADAGMDSSVMFHDADSSGTVSVDDMIHIGETDVEWDEVRLYSISADAYSDENPMHNAPGFTGLVGMLALLGAAFIRRNE